MYSTFIFTVRNSSCGKVMFYRCVCLSTGKGGVSALGPGVYTPPGQTPTGRHSYPLVRHPPGRHLPWQTPLGRYQPLPSGRHQRQTSPSGQTPPQADTPLLGRQTSPGQTPPVDTKGRPPLRQTPKADLPLRRTLQRTVRMLLKCILVLIQFLAQSLPINRLTTPLGLAPPVWEILCLSPLYLFLLASILQRRQMNRALLISIR